MEQSVDNGGRVAAELVAGRRRRRRPAAGGLVAAAVPPDAAMKKEEASILDVSIVGDDEAVPLADRPHVQPLFTDPDPKSLLAGFVGVAAQVNSRTAPIYRILVSAAGSDPDAAALLEEQTRQRQQGQGLIARSLARARLAAKAARARCRRHHPRAHVPRVYGLLVVDRGWPPERYERWLTGILVEQLLSPSGLRPADDHHS